MSTEQDLNEAQGGGSGLNAELDDLPFKAAVTELMRMPRYSESEQLTMAKVKLKDGRDAVIRLELTTEDDAVEEYDIWTPNAELTSPPADASETKPPRFGGSG